MTNAVSRQTSVCLGSLLSMRSFAINEPRSSVRALYATLVHCAIYRIYVFKYSGSGRTRKGVVEASSLITASTTSLESRPKKKDKDKHCQYFGHKLGAASKKWPNHHITGLIQKVPEKSKLTAKLNHITRLRECRIKAWYF